jgi:carboxypeptidase C (cathepsin A)
MKLKSLLEGYAWERKADGSLPTLKDAINTHQQHLQEKSESIAQQQAAAIALQAKRGEIPVSQLTGASMQMYKGMSEKQLEDFAKTKHDGLRKHVDERAGNSSEGTILELVSKAEDMVQNLRSNMSTNSVLQFEEKMGYLEAFNELLDILGDIGFEAEYEE